ncbi:MAG: YfiR family protein [Elusimicrobiota bacterium]|nr:YfiR family protein [Elusimicrobiota bacterium]
MNFKKLFINCFLTAAILFTASYVMAKELPEYKAKAEFIVIVAGFVDWPEDNSDNLEEPFTVGIIGKNPFGAYLKEAVRSKKINGRKIIIKDILIGDDLPLCDCDTLFITKKQYKYLPKIFSIIRDRHILTIGDGKKFAGKGVHIGLYRSGRKIRFAINQSAAKRDGLKISSNLLRLASEVYGDAK